MSRDNPNLGMHPEITRKRRREMGLPALCDDWRSFPYPIPDSVVREQLSFEIVRATRELLALEERIASENRFQRDLDS